MPTLAADDAASTASRLEKREILNECSHLLALASVRVWRELLQLQELTIVGERTSSHITLHEMHRLLVSVLRSPRDEATGALLLMQLWNHEAKIVFGSNVLDPTQRARVHKIIDEATTKTFPERSLANSDSFECLRHGRVPVFWLAHANG